MDFEVLVVRSYDPSGLLFVNIQVDRFVRWHIICVVFFREYILFSVMSGFELSTSIPTLRITQLEIRGTSVAVSRRTHGVCVGPRSTGGYPGNVFPWARRDGVQTVGLLNLAVEL
jgi:hypothetical protein